jgi:hypothetical protein
MGVSTSKTCCSINKNQKQKTKNSWKFIVQICYSHVIK